jgi:hypothetical protein
LETQSEPFVRHPKIAVATDSDRVGSYGSDFLRNHPDIGLLAAIVREAVVTETVVEPTEEHYVVLEVDIRPAPATTASAASKPSTSAAPKSSTAATAKSSTAPECCGSMPATREPRSFAAPIQARRSFRKDQACPKKLTI